MPYEKLEQDIKMMKESGINTIRIAESTWSNVEPKDNVYDFNYSGAEKSFEYPYSTATDLTSKKQIEAKQKIALPAWSLMVVEENK